MIRRILCCFFLFWSVLSCTKKNNLQDIVVKVGHHELKAQDFAQRVGRKLKAFDVVKVKDPQILMRVKNEVIHDFIHEGIVARWAKEKNLSVSENEIEQEIHQIRSHYPDDISFRQSLAQAGKNIEFLKEDIKKRVLEEKVFKMIYQNTNQPTAEDLVSYYKSHRHLFRQREKVHIDHILFETKNVAQSAHQKLKLSRPITEILDNNMVYNRIWIEKGTLDAFEKAFLMKKEAWSDILKSDYGYHIYKVVDKKPNRQWTFEESKATIQRTLMADRQQAAYSLWLEKQIESIEVFRNDKIISSLYVETK